MTSRQARRERREAERKARKAELKHTKAVAAERGFVSQNADASVKRTEINRLNAQHSTGPRTPNGKLASSRNSLKHGLASGELIIPGEDRAAFEALVHDLIKEHDPANETEELLVTEMAQSWWLVQRALRLQNDCFSENGIDEKRLSLFLRYHTTHERTFHKALNTLIRLKQSRAREQAVSKVGFVSQTGHSFESPTRNPEQSGGFEIGFVSQNHAAAPQHATQSLAEAA